jgi:hypothetical protein
MVRASGGGSSRPATSTGPEALIAIVAAPTSATTSQASPPLIA